MNIVESFNALDIQRLALIGGVVLVLAGVGLVGLGQTDQGTSIIVLGIGAITYSKVAETKKVADANAARLTSVTVCTSPDDCEYQKTMEVKK